MNWLSRSIARVQTTARPQTRRTRFSRQLSLEQLEERDVPSTLSTITANFNSTRIPAGDSVWFDSSFKVEGIGRGTSEVTLLVTGQTITFSAAGRNYTENVPDATINLSSSTTVATTTFDASSNSWITNLPIKFAGNAFLSGVILPVSASLPGGIKAVTWSGDFSTDTEGVSVKWHWGAAVYTSLSSNYNALDVKPLSKGRTATVYKNDDRVGTPEAYKSFVTGGATGTGGKNWTGNLTPHKAVTPGLESNGAVLYPFASINPLTSIPFDQSDVLLDATLDTANENLDVWYSGETAMALGVSQVNVKATKSTTTTNYALAALTSDPGSALDPALGTTATTGNQAGVDASGRPIAPSLYITDITNDPNSLSGDWQDGGTAVAPSAVFGTWKGEVKTVNDTTKTPSVTLTAGADPAKNGWNLGPGADPVPAGLTNEGYGTELQWNLNDLYNQGLLIPGHTYRFYVIVHDGAQNKIGGDAGQVAYDYHYPGPANTPPANLSGFVYGDDGAGDLSPLAGVQLTLTGTTASGQQVSLQTTTLADGSYSFATVPAGIYTVTETIPNGYNWESATQGTVNGTPNGSVEYAAITGITLNPGVAGINYDFTVTVFTELS